MTAAFVFRIGRGLASLQVTLGCLAAAAAVVVVGQNGDWPVGVAIAAPFGMLFVNLAAALATNRVLRSQAGLLGFHLALAGLALLIALDRLMAFYGHVEVTEGAAFDPALVEASAGPLHPWEIDAVRFVQGPFEINYAPGMKRRDTVSTVYLPNSSGVRSVEVGDDNPLVAGNYRFYTTFNKGFAPLVTFITRDGVRYRGSVHLPSYPLNYYKQGNDWTLPGTTTLVKLWLHVSEPVYVEQAAWRFQKPNDAALVVIDEDGRHELGLGESVELRDGLLRYDGLLGWMGYTISYNPLMPWMLAAVVVGLACFAWHIFGKVRAMPWDREQPEIADAA